MAFWGCKFSFDGISCEKYELMIYNVGSESQGETTFAHVASIQEERVGNHWRPLFFGVTYENKLECEMVFGLNQERIEEQRHLSRQEMAAISSWLAGHPDYKWLEIEQDDMAGIRYRCMVTDLKVIEQDGLPWAFRATFTCDGPYAYMLPCEYAYTVDGELVIEFNNLSDHNGYYDPIIMLSLSSPSLTDESNNILTDEKEIVLKTGNGFVIENQTDRRTTQFTNLPKSVTKIVLDNKHGVITSDTSDNLYKHFNFRFLRLKRGLNTLKFSGYGTVTFRCEFPVSVGM